MGFFLAFEGGEGSGKSTQSRILASQLQEEGHRVLLTREPGGTVFGEELRALVEKHFEHLGELTQLFSYLAARSQHVQKKIKPALAQDMWVISDRFLDSTVAYQGFGQGIAPKTVHQLNALATDTVPHLTFLLDVSPSKGLARVAQPTSYECFDEAFHDRVREGFLALAAHSPERYVLIDATAGINSIAAYIWHIVQERFILSS